MAEPAKKEKKVAGFISRIKDYRIYMETPIVQIVPGYGKVADQKSGRWIQFRHGRYQTDDKKEIKFLLEHRGFTTKYYPDPADPTNFWFEKGYFKEEEVKVRRPVDPMAIVEEGRKQADKYIKTEEKRVQSIRTAT